MSEAMIVPEGVPEPGGVGQTPLEPELEGPTELGVRLEEAMAEAGVRREDLIGE
ncbi:hypothetical protein [Actinomadura craniellae]|uniref:hypothetical protein n=1 Tax=Actinomadura craniellae TaxID=2231787 RepID=UPI001314998D|nr:hypothetical protein [Actinomadura craniellae]